MTVNPVGRVRRELQLSRREFAVAAGVPYAEVCKSELGYSLRLNARLAGFLKARGYPGDPDEGYRTWRQEAGKAIGARNLVATKAGGGLKRR